MTQKQIKQIKISPAKRGRPAKLKPEEAYKIVNNALETSSALQQNAARRLKKKQPKMIWSTPEEVTKAVAGLIQSRKIEMIYTNYSWEVRRGEGRDVIADSGSLSMPLDTIVAKITQIAMGRFFKPKFKDDGYGGSVMIAG